MELKMKKLMTALLAVSALAAAAPAVAQDYSRGSDRGYDRGYDRGDDRGYDRGDDRRGDNHDGRYGYGRDNLRQEYDRLAQRIQRAQRNRTISYREADRLNQQLRMLRMTDRQYRMSGGGLNRRERMDLDQRVNRLERQIRWERRDGDDRRY